MKTALPSYHVRHSPRSKNLRLKVTREAGLCVVVPAGFDERKIPAILKRKREWIADALKRANEAKRYLEPKPRMHCPESVKLRAVGKSWSVRYNHDVRHAGVRLREQGAEIVISGAAMTREDVILKLKDWLRLKVREELFPVAKQLASKRSLHVNQLLVKSQRTRWASCSQKRNLSLNTKLLFLSPELVRYVLIHELCHIVHMNHGREFWQLVASHEPRYKTLDQALRGAWKTIPQWLF